MRTALSISILLLCVVLALDYQSGLFLFGTSKEQPIPPDASEGRSVRIFTCGATLTPVRFGNMPQPNAIFVDGKMLRYYRNPTGLRVATIPPGNAAPTLSLFNLPRDPAAPEALRELLEAVPIDTAVALSSFRTIQPKGRDSEPQRQVVMELLEELGARTDPTADSLVSWALLSVKRPQGWVALSEAYSRTKGMMIAFNLQDDRSIYDGAVSALRVDQSRESELIRVLDQAVTSPGVRPIGYVRVAGSPLHSFTMPLGEDARVAWRYVHLGSFPTFRCKLAIPSDAHAHVPGARCTLLVNGKAFASRDIGRDAGVPDGWVDWQVDLTPFARRWISLELRAEPLAETPPTAVFWGLPTVTSSPSSTRPRGGFRALMSRLDLNEDGVVGRPEVFEYLISQDSDGDGYLSAEETLYEQIVLGVDRDGDRRASEEELATWYDQMIDPVDFPVD